MRTIERALVLGGTGFLGSAVSERLEEEGITSLIIGRSGVRPTEKASLIIGDLEALDLRSIMEEQGTDTVFHFATSAFVPSSLDKPLEDLNANAASTVRVLEALRALRRPPLLVLASSAAVYGDGKIIPMNEDHPIQPISPYGASKRASEIYLDSYSRLYHLPCFSVRMFSLYGPRQQKQVVYDLLLRLLRDEDPLIINASSEVTRDFLYVKDAAKSLINMARNAPANGEAYNLASGIPTTLAELVDILRAVTAKEAQVRFTGIQRKGDPRFWLGDSRRALALGATAGTSLEEGLALTAAWVNSSLRTNGLSPVFPII